MKQHEIRCQYYSQEDLLGAGCLDIRLAISAVEMAMRAFEAGEVIFPEKVVQIFNEETQERINCLPATFRKLRVCGVKWVSVFPPNPVKFGMQNLSAVIILSEIDHGLPIAFMEGTLCSNLRVGAVGALAARHLANPQSRSIGFIGAGEQAKMHLLAMKSVLPSLVECRVAAKEQAEEETFCREMGQLLPNVAIQGTGGNLQAAIEGADVIVTATSAQAPLLKAAWVKPGSFYSHVGGYEDEYAVAQQADKIVCDDWETVKHRTQTLSRMHQAGELPDHQIHGNLQDIVLGHLPGRQSPEERIYFNAVGLAYLDVAISHAMYLRTRDSGLGQDLKIQQEMIFEHAHLKNWIRI
ncbi:ornithine cyclodeaminase family protein [Lignipirellula cremea]|uniref:L-lysine cyclodeaminase n=1 Tax=Lignipirellula cremea TaxID=2528010 RepID=A0A518DKX4_9BACT|nr:ornithine cyclodeaminase family protein [Lignipirellula cremea]QDU92487.1 L-lysine cyclodeaminase [Lignipirellula cremea]